MYDVFISYSRKDTNVANRICKAFDEAGITYFIDRQGIGGAYEFPQVLAEAIISSKIFLYLASTNSYESKFTQSEITFAFNRKDKGSILPYIIDGSSMPISLEFVFSAINWRNMKEHPVETVLVNDLLRLLGKERKAPQPQEEPVAHASTKQAVKPVRAASSSDSSKKVSSMKTVVWISVAVSAVLLVVLLATVLKTDVTGSALPDATVAENLSNTDIVLPDTVVEKVVEEKQVVDTVAVPEPTGPAKELLITVNDVSFIMKYVPSGRFVMGSTQESAYNDEKPAHNVRLDRGYYIGETEVTQALWKAVMGNNPSAFKGDLHPVEQVSFRDCKNFIARLNELTGRHFRFPTEAEWEFAAHGGSVSKNTKYSGSNVLSEVAWYTTNSGGHTHDAKGKVPNELGLYDMVGNVWEWCSDWYGKYSSRDAVNPIGPASGDYHVYRGGGWCCDAFFSRLTVRGYDSSGFRSSEVGFRLVLDVE